MAKKGFHYNRLLDIKSLILDLKALALRESEDVQRKQNSKLVKIHSAKKTHLEANGPALNDQDKRLSLRDLQVHTWYTEQLNEDLRRQIHEVRKAEQEVQKRRKVVEVSAKEKQSLVKLKEHQEEAALKETERQEQKQLDEIAGRKHSRKEGAI